MQAAQPFLANHSVAKPIASRASLADSNKLCLRTTNVYPSLRQPGQAYRQDVFAKKDGSYFIYTPKQINTGRVYVMHVNGPQVLAPPLRR